MLTTKIQEQLKGEVLNISIWVNDDDTLSATFMTKGLEPAVARGVTNKELVEEIELYLSGKEVASKPVVKTKPSDAKKTKTASVPAKVVTPLVEEEDDDPKDLGTEEENAVDEVLPPVATQKKEVVKEKAVAPPPTVDTPTSDDDFDF